MDQEVAFRKQAGRTCISFRGTVSPAGMRLSLKNPESTVQIKCTQRETQQNTFKRGTWFYNIISHNYDFYKVIIRKWPRLPVPKIINSFYFSSLYGICYKIASVLCFFFFFPCRACGIFTASTRDWTQNPYSESAESELLDCQESKVKRMHT